MSFDHLNLGKDDKVRKILQKHADGLSDEIILYSNRVTKINKKSKAQERVLVITDKAIYNFTPAPVKSRSFSIKQFMKSPQELKDATPKRSQTGRAARASVHSSLKAQPQHQTEGVGQMKRRIVLKQIHTISVSSHVNHIVLHVPNEYDYLYRLPTFKEVEEVVRVLQESSQAVHHFPKAYQFELDSLVLISDNSKSRKKGNETQDQYMKRKLKAWKKKYTVVSYDVKKIITPQQKKQRKPTNLAHTLKLQQPFNKSRAVSIAPGPIGFANHNNPHNPRNRAITNYNAGPSYFNNFPSKSMHASPLTRTSVYTPPATSSHQYAHSMVPNSSNLLQLQQEFPPPASSVSSDPPQTMQKAHTHRGAPPRQAHHRQVYSESFSTNPQYAQRMQMMGAMAYNQQFSTNPQDMPPNAKKKRRRHSHSDSSCGSSCSCSDTGSETGSGSSYTGSSYTGSSDTDDEGSYTAVTATTDQVDTTPQPQPPEIDLGMLVDLSLSPQTQPHKRGRYKKEKENSRHVSSNTMHILPSKTATTPTNRSPIAFDTLQAIIDEAKLEEKAHEEEAHEEEDENYVHNLNARKNQKRRNHTRYARTQTLPANARYTPPIKQMPNKALPPMQMPKQSPNRPLPQNHKNNHNNNNNNNNLWKRNGASSPPTQPNMSMSRSWTPHGANHMNANINNNMNANINHNNNNNNQWNRNGANHMNPNMNQNMNTNMNHNMNQNQNLNLNLNINAMNHTQSAPTPNIPQMKCVSSILEAKQLRVNNKEAYLPDNLFWEVFKMTKAQFYSQRGWKQKKMKRDTGFF